MRRKGIYAVILLTGMAALFIWWGPWRDAQIPDVVRRFSEMQVGDRLTYEVQSGHCFGGSSTEGWIAREAEVWQQSINFLGDLSACIYRLGPPNRNRAGCWIESYESIRLDWNDDGVCDQEWAHSNRVSSLALTLLHGTSFGER